MRIDYLKEFIKIAEVGSLEEAAFQLYTSPSNLSKHVHEMQQTFHCNLFQKNCSELTMMGEEFLKCAKNITKEYDSFISRTEKIPHESQDTIRLGFHRQYEFEAYHLFDIVKDFHILYPQYDIILDDASMGDWVNNGHVNMTIIYESVPYSLLNLNRVKLLTDRIVLIIPEDMPHTPGRPANLSDFKNERFIFLQQRSFITSRCLELCKESGFSPEYQFFSTPKMVINAVAHNIGISLLPRALARHYLSENVKIIELDQTMQFGINLLHRDISQISRAEVEFIDYIKKNRGANF